MISQSSASYLILLIRREMNLKRTAVQAMGKQMAFVAMMLGTLSSEMCLSWYRISAGVGIDAMPSGG